MPSWELKKLFSTVTLTVANNFFNLKKIFNRWSGVPSAVLPMCCVLRYLSAIMRSVVAVGCQILRNQRKSIEIRTKYRRWQEILRNSIQSQKHDDDGTQHKT